jgi:hypothetical protein
MKTPKELVAEAIDNLDNIIMPCYTELCSMQKLNSNEINITRVNQMVDEVKESMESLGVTLSDYLPDVILNHFQLGGLSSETAFVMMFITCMRVFIDDLSNQIESVAARVIGGSL